MPHWRKRRPKARSGARTGTAGVCLGLALALAATGCGSGGSNEYPQRSVKLYVPAQPGGGTDNAARVIINHLESRFDGDVVVVNETGGGGALAVNEVAQSRPDGYSLLFFHEAMLTGYAEGTVRQSAEEFRPLGTPVRQHQHLLVSSDSGWKDIDDFAEAAREDPGGLTMGVNYGQTTHYTGAMLADEAGIDFRVLDSGSEADRVTGLLGGRFDLIVGSTATARQYLDSGDFTALAVTSPERDPVLDEVPTAVEQGYEVNFPLQFTLLAPPEVPDEVARAWNTAFDDLFTDEAYLEAMSEVAEPINLDAAETGAHLREAGREIERINRVIEETT